MTQHTQASSFSPYSQQIALILFGVLASLPLVLPLHFNPIASFHAEWLAFGCGLLAVFLLALRSGEYALPRLSIAPLALALVVLLQAFLGMFAYTANVLLILSYLLWAALLLCAGQTLVRQCSAPVLFRHLAWFIAAGSVLNALAGCLQYLEWDQVFGALITVPMPVNEFGVYGNLAQQNHFATHMALGLASISYLHFVQQLRRWPFLLGAALLISALILSGSRSSFLYLTWLLGLALYYKWRAKFATKNPLPATPSYRHWWPLALFVAAIAALVIAAQFLQIGPQLHRLVNLSAAFGVRGFLWQNAWQMFLQHPVLGVGFDSFAYELIGQFQQINPWGIDQYAHNLPLQLLAVCGLTGAFALGWPMLSFLRRLWRSQFTLEVFAGASILGIFFIHSMLEQPLYYAYFLGIAAYVAGALDSQARLIIPGKVLRVSAALLMAASLLLLGKSALDYAALVRYGYSETPPEPTERAQAMRELRESSLFAALAELAAPEVFVAGDAPALEKIALNQRVLRFAPVAETEYRQAALLAEAGRMLEAKQQFKRAVLAYPNEAPMYLERFDALAQNEGASYAELAVYGHHLLAILAKK